MDLTLPLVGILGVIGYNLNKPMNTREYTEKRIKIPTSELASGKTIYQAREFARIQKAEKLAYEKMRTNNAIVSFNETTDAKIKTPEVLKRIYEPNQNDYKGPDIFPDNKIYTGPMFSTERYFIPESNVKDFVSTETFADVSSLTGEKTDYSHQNMVPFFGGKVKNADTSNTLGRYTGRDLGNSKKEVEAITNGPVNNVHGNVLFTTSIQQDRFIGSNFQTGLLPFDQVRVQPIPEEYNRGRQKTIDELRGDVNPRSLLEGRFTPGGAIAKRAIQGEVPDVRNETTYELGASRQFTTTGEEQKGYFDGTSRFRDTRKFLTAESELNKLAGTDFRKGEILRASKTDDGRNTVVQEDKRGNFKGDWVRSRKAVPNSIEDLPNSGNINLRGQQREETNRAETGNVSGMKTGERSRYDENLKTTNKELSLYTYKGGSNGNGVKKPEDRGAWYRNETKTKKSSEYTPGGKKANTPGVGVETFSNFKAKTKVVPESYIGAGSSRVQPGVTGLGSISKNKIEITENLRNYTQLQKKSYDRPFGKLS